MSPMAMERREGLGGIVWGRKWCVNQCLRKKRLLIETLSVIDELRFELKHKKLQAIGAYIRKHLAYSCGSDWKMDC